jgi:hypothetical protein
MPSDEKGIQTDPRVRHARFVCLLVKSNDRLLFDVFIDDFNRI